MDLAHPYGMVRCLNATACYGAPRLPTWLRAGAVTALVLATPDTSEAANCVIDRVYLLAETVPPDGVVPIAKHCVLKETCDGDTSQFSIESVETPDAGSSSAGVPVVGSFEWIDNGEGDPVILFQSAEELTPGHYRFVWRQTRPYENEHVEPFEVTGEAPVIDLDGAAVALSKAWEPAGDLACCPTTGEGDCYPLCFGIDGEHQVARVELEGEALRTRGIMWRLVPKSVERARPSRWNLNPVGWDEPADAARFFDASPSYCVTLEVRNLVTGEFEELSRCVEEASDSAVGTIEARWPGLESSACTAPPVLGGWGLDLEGVPDPENYLEPPDVLRQAWCVAHMECRVSTDWECDHYEHYCGAGPQPGDGGTGSAVDASHRVDARVADALAAADSTPAEASSEDDSSGLQTQDAAADSAGQAEPQARGRDAQADGCGCRLAVTPGRVGAPAGLLALVLAGGLRKRRNRIAARTAGNRA